MPWLQGVVWVMPPGGDVLAVWAQRTGGRRAVGPARGCLRFAFYGRVSTEDHQDRVSSRARQREQARSLTAGYGRIVAEFFDVGQSRVLAWARRRRPWRWPPPWLIRTGGGTQS